jgi:hypothetical protein
VLGPDGLYTLSNDRYQPVLIAVNLGSGQPVLICHGNEYDLSTIRRFLEPLIQQLGVSVIDSDDLTTFRMDTEKLGVEHQIC